jgi:hypothetical protein
MAITATATGNRLGVFLGQVKANPVQRASSAPSEGFTSNRLVTVRNRATSTSTSRQIRRFPHESTADQFFSESQFESYRMLGAYTMEKLCTDCGGHFRCFIRDILNRHLKMEAPVWLADHSKHREMKQRRVSAWSLKLSPVSTSTEQKVPRFYVGGSTVFRRNRPRKKTEKKSLAIASFSRGILTSTANVSKVRLSWRGAKWSKACSQSLIGRTDRDRRFRLQLTPMRAGP